MLIKPVAGGTLIEGVATGFVSVFLRSEFGG